MEEERSSSIGPEDADPLANALPLWSPASTAGVRSTAALSGSQHYKARVSASARGVRLDLRHTAVRGEAVIDQDAYA
jgi:hypothetical protein